MLIMHIFKRLMSDDTGSLYIFIQALVVRGILIVSTMERKALWASHASIMIVLKQVENSLSFTGSLLHLDKFCSGCRIGGDLTFWLVCVGSVSYMACFGLEAKKDFYNSLLLSLNRKKKNLFPDYFYLCIKVWLSQPGYHASLPSLLSLPLSGTTRLMKSLCSVVLLDNRWVMTPQTKEHDIRKVVWGEQARGVISCIKGLCITLSLHIFSH